MPQAETAAADIDVDFLWECCGADEFQFEALAADYWGHAPSAIEAAAIALRLHGAPMYFYRKGRGHYKAAPEDALKAALAGQENVASSSCKSTNGPPSCAPETSPRRCAAS